MGKTLIAVEAAKRVRGLSKILVVCPRLSKEWWAEVIDAQEAGKVGIAGQGGRLPRKVWTRLAQYQGDEPAWLITHPTGVRMSIDELRSVNWDAIIVDEAHRFKNRRAKQTKALRRLNAGWKVMMTATPYGKAPDDLWALLSWLYPRKYTSYWRFFDKYVDYVKIRAGGKSWRKVRGPRNMKKLAREISPFYLRRTKERLNLPPVYKEDRPVIIDGDQESMYLELAREAYLQLSGKEVILENALVRFLRLQQCSLDPALMADELPFFVTEEVPAKVKWLDEWLDDHPNEPVIITSRYRRFVEKWLVEIAPDSVIVGGMKTDEVQAALNSFQETGRLVGTLDAIKESLNLQRASTMIITDGTYSSVAMYQLENRIHRIGQESPCRIITLIGKLETSRKYTVDMLVRRAVDRKLSEAEMLNAFVRRLRDVSS